MRGGVAFGTPDETAMLPRIPEFSLVLCLLAITPTLCAGGGATPVATDVEVVPAVVAPIREVAGPVQGIPEIPLHVDDVVIARAGRLRLIAMGGLAIEPIPPPQATTATFDGWDEAEVVVAPEPGRPAFRLREESVDNAVFRNMDTEALRREWLGSLLEERIADLVKDHRLTKAQVGKLMLAWRGDVERFFAEVATLRGRFLACRDDPGRCVEVLQEAAPLGLRFQEGPFGGGSLLVKTLAHMTEARR